jgi:hypothetical protein
MKSSENDDVYDDKIMCDVMDYIFEKTYNVPEFRDLYLDYAGKMLSSELDIGMAIAFSYENFNLFHPCLADFMRDGVIGSENYAKIREPTVPRTPPLE